MQLNVRSEELFQEIKRIINYRFDKGELSFSVVELNLFFNLLSGIRITSNTGYNTSIVSINGKIYLEIDYVFYNKLIRKQRGIEKLLFLLLHEGYHVFQNDMHRLKQFVRRYNTKYRNLASYLYLLTSDVKINEFLKLRQIDMLEPVENLIYAETYINEISYLFEGIFYARSLSLMIKKNLTYFLTKETTENIVSNLMLQTTALQNHINNDLCYVKQVKINSSIGKLFERIYKYKNF